MAEARAEIIITARDAASQQFANLAQNVRQMNSAFKETTTGAQSAVSRFARELNRFTDDGRKAVGQVTSLRDRMVRVGEAFASGQITATQAARAMKEIADEAGKSAKGVNDLGSANQTLKGELQQVAQEASQDAETFKKLAEAQREAEEQARKLGEAYQTLGTQARNIGLAFGGLAALGVAAIKSTAELAGRVETLGVVMNVVGQNAGYSAGQLADFEEKIRSAGITTQVARETVIQMARANLDLSKSFDVARAAQDAAVIGGINSSEALQRIIYGVTTLNTRVLRTMGIMVDFRQAQEDFAKAADRSTLSLSSQEKQAIALDEFIRKSAMISGAYTSAMDTVGKKVTSLARLHEEAALAIGNAFLPAYGGVVDMLTVALTKFNEMEAEQKEGVGTALGYATAISGVEAAYFLLLAQIPGLITLVKDLGAAFKLTGASLGVAAGVGAAAVATWAVAGIKIIETMAMIEEGNQAVMKALKDHNVEVLESAKTYGEYRAEMERAARAAGLLIDAQGNLIEAHRGGGRAAAGMRGEIKEAGLVMSEAAVQAQFLGDELKENKDRMRANAEAGMELTQVQDELAAELELTNAKMLLQNSLSGEIGKAFETYAGKVATLKEKQAELTLEMEKYEAAQGKVIPATINLAEAQNAQALAAFKLEEAQARLAEAQKALSENTDPERQREMEGAVLAAQVAVDKAAGSVATWTDKLSGGTGTLADYSEKIAGLKEQFEGNEEALRNLTAAHDEHLNRIIFSIAQQALYSAMKAAGIEVTVEMQLALLEEARQLGLVDEATYLATQRMLSWTEGVIDGTDKIDHLNVRVEATKDQIETGLNPAVAAATTATYGFRDSLVDAKNAALAADEKARGLTDAINGIPRYTRIDIETYHTTFRRWVDLGGGGGGGGGGLEAAPPGDIPEGAGVVLPPAPAAPPRPAAPAAPQPSRPPPRSYIPREERQRGGPVTAGWPYIVGEAGPEWFVPRQSGTVVPGAGGMRLRLEVPIYLDGREIGKAAYDGLVEEARARGMRLTPVA